VNSYTDTKVRKQWVNSTGETPSKFVPTGPGIVKLEREPGETNEAFLARLKQQREAAAAAKAEAEVAAVVAETTASPDSEFAKKRLAAARLNAAREKIAAIQGDVAARKAAEAGEASRVFKPTFVPRKPAPVKSKSERLQPGETSQIVEGVYTWQRNAAIMDGNCFYDAFLFATDEAHRGKTLAERAVAAAAFRQNVRENREDVLFQLSNATAVPGELGRISEDKSLNTIFTEETKNTEYTSIQLAMAIARWKGYRLVVIDGDQFATNSSNIYPAGTSDFPEPGVPTVTLSYIAAYQHFEPVSIDGRFTVPGEEYPNGLVALLRGTQLFESGLTEEEEEEAPLGDEPTPAEVNAALATVGEEPPAEKNPLSPEEQDAVIADITKQLKQTNDALDEAMKLVPPEITDKQLRRKHRELSQKHRREGTTEITPDQFSRLTVEEKTMYTLKDSGNYELLDTQTYIEGIVREIQRRKQLRSLNAKRAAAAPPAAVLPTGPSEPLPAAAAAPPAAVATPEATDSTRLGAPLPGSTVPGAEIGNPKLAAAETAAASVPDRPSLPPLPSGIRSSAGTVKRIIRSDPPDDPPEGGRMRKKTFKSRRGKKTNGRGTRRRKDRANRSHKNSRRGA
jgi:hypothetical protein